jgi:pimeloyl-ACP methyl ester carboxylesterase
MINAPVLVIAGERDVVEPVATLRSNLIPYLSSADFVTIPETGHLIPLETPAALAKVIIDFSTGR